jgi:hypothetical protein
MATRWVSELICFLHHIAIREFIASFRPQQLPDHTSPTWPTSSAWDQRPNLGMGPASMQSTPPLMHSYSEPYASSSPFNQFSAQPLSYSGRKRGLCVSPSHAKSMDLSFMQVNRLVSITKELSGWKHTIPNSYLGVSETRKP